MRKMDEERCEQIVLKSDNVVKTYKETDHAIYRQVLGVTTMMILMILGAMVTGYSGILLPQLLEDDSKIKITKDHESWIAAMAPLQMSLGCIFSSWTMDKFGRKVSNISCTILALFGWLAIALSTSLEMILVGRVICGLYVGLSGMASTAFIAEISATKYRGLFLSFIALSISLGVFLIHLMGIYLTWQTTAFVTSVIPVALIGLLVALPESHVWYMNRHEIEKARKSFHWYRGNSALAKEEFEQMVSKCTIRTNTFRDMANECKKQEFYIPFLILLLFFTTTQVSGSNIVSFYSVQLMQMTVPSLNKYASMMVLDVIRVVISIIASILTKRYRVRVLLFISVIGTVLSLFALSGCVHMAQLYPDNKLYTTTPLVFLITYIVFISIGLVPLPWTVCGEILPPATKGVGGGIACAVNFFAFFLVIKTSPDLFDWFGTAGTFAFYGMLVAIGSVGLYYYLPETKNRSLHEIQEYFKKPESVRTNKDVVTSQ